MPKNLRQCPKCEERMFVLNVTKCFHCGEELPMAELPSAKAVDALLAEDETGVAERIKKRKTRNTGWFPEGGCGDGGGGSD